MKPWKELKAGGQNSPKKKERKNFCWSTSNISIIGSCKLCIIVSPLQIFKKECATPSKKKKRSATTSYWRSRVRRSMDRMLITTTRAPFALKIPSRPHASCQPQHTPPQEIKIKIRWDELRTALLRLRHLYIHSWSGQNTGRFWRFKRVALHWIAATRVSRHGEEDPTTPQSLKVWWV